MLKESYELFGLPETATDEELEERYGELKARYNEEKWEDGEKGMNAARMLGKLDAAYQEIKDSRHEKPHDEAGGSAAYEEVSSAIRSGDLSRAQSLLDGFNERGAEWHYLQSVVFYKKNWINESKKQLEIAIQMDGGNEKYRTAYEKLKARAEYTPQTGNAPHIDPANAGGEQMGGNWCVSCVNACYTFLCVNCLFNLCCGCR